MYVRVRVCVGMCTGWFGCVKIAQWGGTEGCSAADSTHSSLGECSSHRAALCKKIQIEKKPCLTDQSCAHQLALTETQLQQQQSVCVVEVKAFFQSRENYFCKTARLTRL